MAHTPGPWTVIGDSIWARNSDACIMWTHVKAKCGNDDDFYACARPHAEVVVHWKSPDDLALTLAAPDLLAACEHALTMVDTDQGPPDWDVLRAAVAKARKLP